MQSRSSRAGFMLLKAGTLGPRVPSMCRCSLGQSCTWQPPTGHLLPGKCPAQSSWQCHGTCPTIGQTRQGPGTLCALRSMCLCPQPSCICPQQDLLLKMPSALGSRWSWGLAWAALFAVPFLLPCVGPAPPTLSPAAVNSIVEAFIKAALKNRPFALCSWQPRALTCKASQQDGGSAAVRFKKAVSLRSCTSKSAAASNRHRCSSPASPAPQTALGCKEMKPPVPAGRAPRTPACSHAPAVGEHAHTPCTRQPQQGGSPSCRVR